VFANPLGVYDQSHERVPTKLMLAAVRDASYRPSS
jgi:hypothetical protein